MTESTPLQESLKRVSRQLCAAGVGLMAAAWILLFPQRAGAVPLFARTYKMSCASCHAPAYPELNAFGMQIKRNGYQIAPGELQGKEDVGDERLELFSAVPLAVWINNPNISWQNRREPRVDFTLPGGVMFLSYGSLAENIGYGLHYGLGGEVEKGYFVFNDLVQGAELDLRVGQFERTDWLFSQLRRLTLQDYAVFNAHVGEWSLGGLDRGIELTGTLPFSQGSLFYQAALLNGNSTESAGGHAHGGAAQDNNSAKDLLLQLAPTLGRARVGFFGYWGASALHDEASETDFTNEFKRLGVHFTTDAAGLQLYGLFLTAKDEHPALSSFNLEHQGGFLGIQRPIGERAYGVVRYDFISSSDDPALKERLLTLNLTHLLRRNFKLGFEVTLDLQKEDALHPAKEHRAAILLDASF